MTGGNTDLPQDSKPADRRRGSGWFRWAGSLLPAPNTPGKDGSTRRPGVAVITYKRADWLDKCLSAIKSNTPGPYDLIVVCDSDEDAETMAVCEKHGVEGIFAPNRGVVWNKNRALFHFMSQTGCDPIILLEDDSYPMEPGWLDQWAEAARRWHHVNYSHPALFAEGRKPVSGDGTPGHPHIHTLVTGQCTAVSRHAMQTAGYLDTRFSGYGHGHVEWTRRHANLLYKNNVEGFSASTMLFLSIGGGIRSENAPSFRNAEDVARNAEVLRVTIRHAPKYLDPWKSDSEKEVLLSEIGTGGRRESAGYASILRRISRQPAFRGSVDGCVRKRRAFCIRGWAAHPDGKPVSHFHVRIGDKQILDTVVTKSKRMDVVRACPDIDPDCGFELAFNLAEQVSSDLEGQEVVVSPMADEIAGQPLASAQRFVWPPRTAVPVPDSPHMPEKSVQRLGRLMMEATCYLEYGSGGTTLKAADIGVPVIVSVESDPDWLDAVDDKIKKKSTRSETILLHSDIGPTREWGLPVDDAGWKNYPAYALDAWAQCRGRGLQPDLILIDGRFRVACCLATLLFAKPGARILFDDYLDRPDLMAVERFVKPEGTFDRVAEFVVPDNLPRDDIWLALIEACSNPN